MSHEAAGAAGDTVGGIDLGTNSTRLLVGRPTADGGLETIERKMTITRLGQGTDGSGRLDPEALERTLAVVRSHAETLAGHGVGSDRLRVSATSAARDAANRDELFGGVRDALGVEAELLSGEDEARLSYRGATAGLDPGAGPFLAFDLGGGSTEFALGTGSDAEAVVSVPVGCVRLSERFLDHDPPQPEELMAAISLTEAHLDDVVRGLPGATEAGTVIGLAGTVSTVAAVELGLATDERDRIHGLRLTREAVEDVFRTLATEDHHERLGNPGLEEARADVIVGGCCALVAIMRTLGLDEIRVSVADILDGLALSVLD